MLRWLRRFARRHRADADLEAEIAFHLEEEARLQVDRGQSPDSARLRARRLFGNVAVFRESTRDVWAWARLVLVWRSVCVVTRSFTRAREFAAAAVLAVALGIGANTLVFAMFDQLLFRPLPYGEPHRLVQVQATSFPEAAGDPLSGAPRLNLSITQALAREKDLFTGMAWATGGATPLRPVLGENPLLWLTPVTHNTLDVLGVRPLIGPGFSVAGSSSDTDLPVLLTYETWQRQYGGSDSVLSFRWAAPHPNRTIETLAIWRIVGVLPKGFVLPSPRLVRPEYDGLYGVDPRFDRPAGTDQISIAPFARLAPGVSIAAARVRANAAARATHADPRRRAVSVVPLQSGLSVTVRRYVWLAVMGACVVLAATCLTLGILLLTWSHSRRLDAGVRLALGASPRRLVTTALLESALLSGAGAAIGWLGYAWTRGLFINAMPRGLQSFAADTADVRLIAMTCGTAMVSAVVAGTLPAVRISRVNPLDAFRPMRGSTIDRLVGGPVLLSVQATFGMLLLVGACAVVPGVIGFLLRSPGFEPANLFVLTVPTSFGPDATNAMEQTRRGHAVMEVARGLPGVASVALSQNFSFTTREADRLLPNRLAPRGFKGRVLAVGADFFDTLAVPIIAGRTFSNDEINRQALVAIVNETGARALWPDLPAAGAIGRTVTTSDGPRIVVGVTVDIRIAINEDRDPSLFLPLSADEFYRQADTNQDFYNSFQVILRMAPGRVPDNRLLSDRLRGEPWMNSNWTGTPQPESVASTFEPALEQPRLARGNIRHARRDHARTHGHRGLRPRQLRDPSSPVRDDRASGDRRHAADASRRTRGGHDQTRPRRLAGRPAAGVDGGKTAQPLGSIRHGERRAALRRRGGGPGRRRACSRLGAGTTVAHHARGGIAALVVSDAIAGSRSRHASHR